MGQAMASILEGEASPVLVAAFAVALRMRGETVDDLTEAVETLRDRLPGPPFPGHPVLIDTCGTGGDGAGTFNVSTVSAVVVAACGGRVAKHGNRAVSSRAGSADVLEALGIVLEPSAALAARQLETLGITFLFAPAHHAALRHVAAARRELGVRTFFNLLGPLANPARATHQLLGVHDRARLPIMAEVLLRLGVTAAWVVHGHGGLDEVSPSGATDVVRLAGGRLDSFQVSPSDFGLAAAPLEALLGGDAAHNARLARAVLNGEPGGRRTAVLLNAAATLVMAGMEPTLAGARARAEHAINSGAAAATLEAWVASGRKEPG